MWSRGRRQHGGLAWLLRCPRHTQRAPRRRAVGSTGALLGSRPAFVPLHSLWDQELPRLQTAHPAPRFASRGICISLLEFTALSHIPPLALLGRRKQDEQQRRTRQAEHALGTDGNAGLSLHRRQFKAALRKDTHLRSTSLPPIYQEGFLTQAVSCKPEN